MFRRTGTILNRPPSRCGPPCPSEPPPRRWLGRNQLLAFLLGAIFAATPAIAAPGEYVILGHVAGVLTRPDTGSPPHIAIVYDNGPVSPMHPMCHEMAKRGFVTWCAISSFPDEISKNWSTGVLQEVGSAIVYLRKLPGIDTIVLYGHSGGGAVASLYEATAENGALFCNDPRKLFPCGDAVAGLSRADAVVFPDAHPGMAVMNLRGINPSVSIEGNKVIVDPSLDPFDLRNGFNRDGASHYTASFQERYFTAQASVMNQLVDRAQAIEAGIANGAISNPAAEQIVIPRFGVATHLDELDPTIAVTMSTVRPERLLRNDGTIAIQKIDSVWTGRSPFVDVTEDIVTSARNFLDLRAVRAQDSMSKIDWCSANSDTVCNTRQIRAPVLFIAAGASDFIADEERMFDGSPSSDKEYIVVEGALHAGKPCIQCEKVPGQYANSEKNQYDYIASWLNKRFSR
jgi:pimeloyl-ACP methyl ester carboxylesterase